MPTTESVPPEPGSAPDRGLGRRALLTGGAAGLGLGAALGLGGALLGGRALQSGGGSETDGGEAGFGGEELGCHGAHQAGIVTAPGAHIRFLAYRLLEDTDADALARMFNILTGDIEALTAGEGPLADPEPELAARPARLSITVGVGAGLVERVSSARRPEWLGPLPAFTRDRLGNGYDDGDLLLMVQADDLLPVAHAARMLERDLVSFAEPLWSQQGFRQARGAEASGTTMRNLMGQVDGTENPSPEDDDLASLIWLDGSAAGEGWLAGGSALVLRRIRMELDTWDQVDRPGREQTIGRRLSDGSPLSAPAASADERTPSDFEATNEYGLPLIPSASHIRRAHSEDPGERIFRRAVNYEQDGESGLLFACYQRDPLSQFVPIQGRLDELDLLNEWITHTGSAVFAILPGFREGETLGASLFAR
ncbi:Dyp-type peroxidase [Leucobacter weissii]|uniref:Dyp-type peroxidase n=1 Tax=Leucobacter weissii TaxID=1983706 RepID=A0A939MIR3_9MICO|nr:Dyp-type peroxidase [Leucobacter weissii]MBO1900995.1 Dyp-type peroxidase [Leucobacter weissii]